MLEKIRDERFKTVSVACQDLLYVLEEIMRNTTAPVVAEIGVGVGATTLKMCEILDNRGDIHIFDFHESVDDLKQDLANLGYGNVIGHGNSRKTLDSYAWSLAKLALDRETRPTFDLVFIDGAHNFIHDAPASLAAAEMMRIGGYILFDDLTWRYCDTQTMNPKTNPTVASWFTEEQTSTAQVSMVCRVFFDASSSYRRIHVIGDTPITMGRALYQKIA